MGDADWSVLPKTETDDIPMSLLAFQGRLVAGIGKALRIYDIGKKKLLRKAESKASLPPSHQTRVLMLTLRFTDLRVRYHHPEHTGFAYHSRRHARIYRIRRLQSTRKQAPCLR